MYKKKGLDIMKMVLNGNEKIFGVSNINNGEPTNVECKKLENSAFWFVVRLHDGWIYNGIYRFSYNNNSGWNGFYEGVLADLADIVTNELDDDVNANAEVTIEWLNEKTVERLMSWNKIHSAFNLSDGTWGWTKPEEVVVFNKVFSARKFQK